MIGTILGKNNININRMQVGQEPKKQQNVILLSTDVPVNDKVLEELQAQENVFSVKRIEL
jgi:D-3-phosphoglycerate dehydrogenase